MTPRDVLIAAKALIDTPEKWCQGHERVGKRRCAARALITVIGLPMGFHFADLRGHPAYQILNLAMSGQNLDKEGWVAYFNDTHSHRDVMDAWDRAIELAGES